MQGVDLREGRLRNLRFVGFPPTKSVSVIVQSMEPLVTYLFRSSIASDSFAWDVASNVLQWAGGQVGRFSLRSSLLR